MEKLNNLKNWQVSIILFLVGFLTFFKGLKNPFQGDDVLQLSANPVVHHLSNIKLFFIGGTFYNSQGISPLSGSYYRPIMTTSYSVIYSIFGSNQLYFHLIQLLLVIACSFMIYLIFRYSFENSLALFLSLIYLVHPLNSQIVYMIADYQEALFMLFGLIGIWMLIKYTQIYMLVPAIACLFIALFSKESAISFIVIGGFFELWWDRDRLKHYLVLISLPLVIYFWLRFKAVGFLSIPNNAPIDKLDLLHRLLNLPEIFLFYISKFVFPLRLSSIYYWTNTNITIGNFWLPLVVDLIFFGLIFYFGYQIYIKSSKLIFKTYIFFGLWYFLGLVFVTQIIPLDFTVFEPWFSFSFVGLIGLIGLIIQFYWGYLSKYKSLLLVLGAFVLLILSARSIIRSSDYSVPYKLALSDISSSADAYTAYNNLSIEYYALGDYKKAVEYGLKSVAIFPTAVNSNSLGESQIKLKDYKQAYITLEKGLSGPAYFPLYDNLSVLTAYYGEYDTNRNFLITACQYFPKEIQPWFYLAVLDYRNNNLKEAKTAIKKAHDLAGNQYSDINQLQEVIDSGRKIKIVF